MLRDKDMMASFLLRNLMNNLTIDKLKGVIHIIKQLFHWFKKWAPLERLAYNFISPPKKKFKKVLHPTAEMDIYEVKSSIHSSTGQVIIWHKLEYFFPIGQFWISRNVFLPETSEINGELQIE